MAKKPKKVDPLKQAIDDLKTMRKSGIKELDQKLTMQYLQMVIQEMLPLMDAALFGDPEAENYIVMTVKNDGYPERNFNVVLHKAGKKFPPEGVY